ncbi:hypothetical protein XalbCFBP2523_04890 [Xanthomonas albilineans]|nr:hypothetical protein XalbCFBP2523_04890 [Xanthomonas albilineans]
MQQQRKLPKFIQCWRLQRFAQPATRQWMNQTMLSETIVAEALSPSIFSLILLPTEKCNFRCTYCYEDFATGRMQPKVVEGIKALEHLDGYICYAAKPNSLMIRANGRIGKCTVALNDDRNDLGKLHADGTIEVANDKLRLWMNGFSDLSEQSLGCPLSSLATTNLATI